MIKRFLALTIVYLVCLDARANLADFNALVAGSSYAAPAIFSNGGLDFELLFSLGNLNVSTASGLVNPAFNGNYLQLTANIGLNINLPTGASQIQFDFIRNSPATAFVVNGGWVDANFLPATVNGINVTSQLPTNDNWGSISLTGNINTFYIVGTEYLIDNLNATPLPGLAGDFNRNHAVDAADYVLLRKTLFTRTGYHSWRVNFGATNPGIGASTVPEPTVLWLTIVALVGLPRRGRSWIRK